MKRLSQQDPRWADMHINKTNSTLRYHGCLIVSLCMLYSKFNPKTQFFPDFALSEWKFIGDLMDWRKTDYKKMKFLDRIFGYDPVVVEKLVKDGYGIVLQVLTRSGVHWMAVEGWGYLGKPVCYDPFYGDILFNPYGFLGRYVRPIGYAVFKKVE